MTDERIKRSVGSTIELISLCKEVLFGDSQISNKYAIALSVNISATLIYNCEAWSNISENDFKQLQNAQLAFLKGLGRSLGLPLLLQLS